MGKINLLDVEISNKIAAGEVVERPASVIKEMVENSIDAGAKRITVEIRKGGNTYMKVTDDGCGMEKDDATVAFLRHATSKIKAEEDLDAIYTLGFRGEALSSIGAVSLVDLYTKRAEDEIGVHTVCEGGEIITGEDAGVANGTTFIIRNLFYNVPARMKFLKKDATEAGYISDIMSRFILAHPDISFRLINNGKDVLFSSGDGNLKNSIYSVYGKDYANEMLEVDYTTDYVRVSGMTGKGSTARPNRNYQSFFINKRYIKSPLIMRAVEEAYKNQIMIGKFPVSVLNIEINPALVDINVHPTKLEVKFSNESEIYQAVYNAVKEALYRLEDIPKIITKEQPQNFIKDSVSADNQVKLTQFEEERKEKPGKALPKFEYQPQKAHIVKEANVLSDGANSLFNYEKKETVAQIQAQKIEEIKDETPTKPQQILKPIEEVKKEVQTEETKKEIEFSLIGQIFDTYIIIECDNEIRLIDQHAAHERLNYEELKVRLREKNVYTQGLLVPVVVDLTSGEKAVFLENLEFLASIGFESEEFGNNSVIIRSVPNNAINDDISDLFIEILSQLEEHKRDIISDKQERLLYTIACKAAIKANHRLDEREQKELVKKVFELENINTCPHGRPIVITMSKKEIEKQFKRIV